ncbi:hypothetical protein EVAR_79690_1 [Eumeta japonica]|uniref:Uncharacterized protein n=1 Tax=Eumeta variegata TaxID=151549 RepID=A0A4C1T8Z9_EUMVA|nr:hypothetical protein EVAR_79690_1 [Eumeta japonica]
MKIFDITFYSIVEGQTCRRAIKEMSPPPMDTCDPSYHCVSSLMGCWNGMGHLMVWDRVNAWRERGSGLPELQRKRNSKSCYFTSVFSENMIFIGQRANPVFVLHTNRLQL